MSWTRQLTATLRRAASPSAGSCAALTCAMLSIRGPRHPSRLAHMSTRPLFDVKELLGKTFDFGPTQLEHRTPAQMWAQKSDNLNLSPPPDTWTGRRMDVRNGDLHAAFQQLNQRLRSNNVAKELSLVVRHEKKGDKRARLRSQRWRRRFANAVRKKVQLVDKIRRRGG